MKQRVYRALAGCVLVIFLLSGLGGQAVPVFGDAHAVAAQPDKTAAGGASAKSSGASKSKAAKKKSGSKAQKAGAKSAKKAGDQSAKKSVQTVASLQNTKQPAKAEKVHKAVEAVAAGVVASGTASGTAQTFGNRFTVKPLVVSSGDASLAPAPQQEFQVTADVLQAALEEVRAAVEDNGYALPVEAAAALPRRGTPIALIPVQEKAEVAALVPMQEVRQPKAPQISPAPSGSPAPKAVKDLKLNVRSAILINMTTGDVYYEQNPDAVIAPASITKLLTLYLVREAMAQGTLSPKTLIPVSAKAVNTGGSRMALKKGEKVALEDLIKGISVVSANNACVAVAEYMSKGDTAKFVAQMNAKAKKLGMTKSTFKNPNGLPAKGQLSTARDLAKLSISYLRKFPESLPVHSMTSFTYHGSTRRNANSLLRTYDGVDGLKTGFVNASGFNITVTAKRGKTRLLAVVLGADNPVIRQVETAKLLDYGFTIVEGGPQKSRQAASGFKPFAENDV
ncbi:D-alanyl-D-alanine carboxypeptidase family protein [Desulfovibrio psychrotolerans]|uniref:D-alanyl-D-alanine carboxypeptidase family protein n=1 Tax=Desulfovibrio psychrotolerans TaxID=415242 RepID=UPI00157AEE8A|nr:D-alanyl-D-alanine carboxypeptidase family protein [Desulfovibrio psychrotolerans]